MITQKYLLDNNFKIISDKEATIYAYSFGDKEQLVFYSNGILEFAIGETIIPILHPSQERIDLLLNSDSLEMIQEVYKQGRINGFLESREGYNAECPFQYDEEEISDLFAYWKRIDNDRE